MLRLQMKLGRDTVIALNEMKRLSFSDPDIPITNGYVLGIAYNRIKDKNINWKKVSTDNIPNVTDDVTSDIKGVKTTLNIEQNIFDGLTEIQNSFFSIFDLKRVHKAFVVKLVLFAAILDYYEKL